jgi:hypothetical protein
VNCGAREFLGIFRELCALALPSCRMPTTLHSTGDTTPCTTLLRTRELDDHHRNLHEAQSNQRHRINEVTHDNLLPEVT